MLQHDDEQRYSRHLSLKDFGAEGVRKIRASRVLIIGMGGLGCPLAQNLAASGVGTLVLVDADRVALSNLGRQILFETADIGRLKVDAAADALHDLNPECILEKHATRLDEANAESLITACDVVADGSDNPSTRFLVNEVCHRLKKPLVSAAIHSWEGQLYRFDTAAGTACYRCLYPNPPRDDEVPQCRDSGVFTPLAGLMGSWQAGEVMKQLLRLGESGVLHRIDLLTGRSRLAKIIAEKNCPVCSH